MSNPDSSHSSFALVKEILPALSNASIDQGRRSTSSTKNLPSATSTTHLLPETASLDANRSTPISGGSTETAYILPKKEPKTSCTVDSTNRSVDEALSSSKTSANFSHDLLIFLLWTYNHGLEEAIRRASNPGIPLGPPFPQTLEIFSKLEKTRFRNSL